MHLSTIGQQTGWFTFCCYTELTRPNRSRQLSTVAVLSFEFELYHFVFLLNQGQIQFKKLSDLVAIGNFTGYSQNVPF